MHEEAKITSKGQITVPKRIRARLGVKDGDTLSFDEEGEKVVVSRVRKVSPFEKYRGILKQGKGRTREEIIRDIREMRDGDSREL